MPKLGNFAAIIFDLDGLVLDSESTYYAAWQQAAGAMGYSFSEAFCQSLSGLHDQDVAQKLGALCGVDFSLPEFKRLSGHFWRNHVTVHGIDIKPGFLPLLAYIIEQNIPYCLATNSPAVNALECLALAGLKGVFPHIISRDDVQRGKPEADIFLKAAEVLGVNINRCLVLEDSHAGIVAAAKAGAYSLFIPSVLPADTRAVALCDDVMSDLTAVLEMLRVLRHIKQYP